MASPKQVELFRRLTGDRDFGTQNTEELRNQFANLSDRNASQWIERALDLPKKSDEEQDAASVAPPF